MKIFSVSDVLRMDQERYEQLASEMEKTRRIQNRICDLVKISDIEHIAKQSERHSRAILSTCNAASQMGQLMGESFAPLAEAIRREHERMRVFETGMRPQWLRTFETIGDTVRNLRAFPFEDIGRTLRLSEEARRTLASGFLDVTGAYRGYVSRMEESSAKGAVLPSSLFEMPAIGYSEELRFVTSISVPGRQERREVRKQEAGKLGPPFYQKQNARVREILGKVDPDLVVFWDEAGKEGLSDSPAKGKYVCTALRTVMSEFLKALAPPVDAMEAHGDDADIAASKGKSSRLKAQVRNIVGIDDPVLSSVIEEEVAFLMTCLHKGNHGVGNALALDAEHIYGIVGVTSTLIRMLSKFHERKYLRRKN